MAALAGFALGAVAMATPRVVAAAWRLDGEPALPPSLAAAFGVPAGSATPSS